MRGDLSGSLGLLERAVEGVGSACDDEQEEAVADETGGFGGWSYGRWRGGRQGSARRDLLRGGVQDGWRRLRGWRGRARNYDRLRRRARSYGDWCGSGRDRSDRGRWRGRHGLRPKGRERGEGSADREQREGAEWSGRRGRSTEALDRCRCPGRVGGVLGVALVLPGVVLGLRDAARITRGDGYTRAAPGGGGG